MKRLTFRIDVLIKGRGFSSDKLDLLLKLWTFHLKVHRFSNDGLELKVSRIKEIKKPKPEKLEPSAWRQVSDRLI